MMESIISRLLMIFLTTPWSFNYSWSCPCGTYTGCQGFTKHSTAGNMAKYIYYLFYLFIFFLLFIPPPTQPIWQNAVWFWIGHITHLTLCASSLFIPYIQQAQQFNLEDWIGQWLLYSTSSEVICFSKKIWPAQELTRSKKTPSLFNQVPHKDKSEVPMSYLAITG